MAYRNLSRAALISAAVRSGDGILSSQGALSVKSGAHTGRVPKAKRLVAQKPSMSRVDWGPVNIQLGPTAFHAARTDAISWLDKAEEKYIIDGFAGADPKHALKIRVVCSRPYHALFMKNMLIDPTPQQLESFGVPDFTIYNAGKLSANPNLEGLDGLNTLVALNFEDKEVVILGTEYAGEMKKGVFTIMNYLMPLQGVLSLHSSANESLTDSNDVSLFFGLSGTGKTTLSADPNRKLIGDDEHCWSNDGIFNIEGGCYAKAIDLSPEKEPEIFKAIRFGSVLENVVMSETTQDVDFKSRAITENTRVCYPIEYIPNAKLPGVASHPKNIMFLTCDACGVLPPVSLLTPDQAMYHFTAGYTSKVAGTEQGVAAPQATFSSCFGAPFLVHSPLLYSKMLRDKLKMCGAKVWLINTGWFGGPPGVGKRIPLKYSRDIVDAIHSGELEKVMSTSSNILPLFDLEIPTQCVNGVPASLFNPINAWKDSGKSEIAFVNALKKLKDLFDRVLKNQEVENAKAG